MLISDWSSDVCSSDLCASAIALATLAFALLPLASGPSYLLVLLGIAMFASIGITSIPPITVGLLLPNRMRGFAIASYYLVIALFGVGIGPVLIPWIASRSEEHTSELQSLMRISYAVFCLKKKKQQQKHDYYIPHI